MKKLIHWLGSRNGSVFSVVFAIVNRTMLAFLASTIGRDKILQLHISENLLSGKGLTTTRYFFKDIYSPVIEASFSFPPGYSLVMAPLLKLFNHNYYAASVTFDLLVVLSFIYVLRRIAYHVGFSTLLTNILTLVFGSFQYVFFMKAPPTDAIGLLLVFICLDSIVKIVNDKKRLALSQILLTGILFILPALFRFMYIPLIILFPLFISMAGYWQKEKNTLRNGILLSAFSFSMLVFSYLVLAFFDILTLPEYGIETGLFPENLSRWYPFIPASFISLDFAALQIDRFSRLSYSDAIVVFDFLNVVLFLSMVGLLFIPTLRNKFKEIADSQYRNFLFSGSMTGLTILIVLTYSSLTYSRHIRPGSLWTFVYEERHFGYLLLFIQFVFFSVLGFYFKSRMSTLKKYLILVPVFALGLECLHGVYFNIKAIFHFNEMKTRLTQDADYRGFISLCRDIEKMNPGQELIVSSTDRYYYHRAILDGLRGIYDAKSLNQGLPRTNTPSLLLVAVPLRDKWILKEFLSNFSSHFHSHISGTDFYLIPIKP